MIDFTIFTNNERRICVEIYIKYGTKTWQKCAKSTQPLMPQQSVVIECFLFILLHMYCCVLRPHSGAFDCVLLPHSGQFNQTFSKKSNSRGFARGEDDRSWNQTCNCTIILARNICVFVFYFTTLLNKV